MANDYLRRVYNGKGKEKEKKKKGKTALIIIAAIVLVFGSLFGWYVYNNMHPAYEKQIARILQKGFTEKQVTLDDGSVINYGEGPDNGPALLLIHGQGGYWEDYSGVLPTLSKKFHIYAVDCYGHGQSTHETSLYSCEANGEALSEFIKNTIGEQCFASGHSSGGILTAWLAAYAPEQVKGIVLEDPPIFNVLPEEMQEGDGSGAWLDCFLVKHNYLNQTEESDYAIYHIKNSYFMAMFGDMRKLMVKSARAYIKKHPGEPVKIFWLPNMINGGLNYGDFDLQFSETFYTGSWFTGIDFSSMLSKIKCPTIYLKAKTQYGKDGVLYAANSDEDVQRIMQLVTGCDLLTVKSGHNIHCDKPKFFISAFDKILEKAE